MRRREAETLPGLLGELAGGTRAALIFDDLAISATELADRASRLAGGLAASGIGAGDRVALWLPNRPEWLELHLALARLGALTVAVNTRFRAHEVREALERVRVPVPCRVEQGGRLHPSDGTSRSRRCAFGERVRVLTRRTGEH